MRRALLAAFAVIVGGASCAEDKASVFGETAAPSSAAPAPGSIAMRLIGTDAQGRPYWLRSATFTITPAGGGLDAGAAGGITVSSEDDPDADTLSVSLDPGSYEVSLQPGWYLEYQTAGGVQRARNVRLTSPATQSVIIAADQLAELVFRFAVDDSGRGTLGIGVEVETVDAGADAGVAAPDAGPTVDGGLDAGLGSELDAGELDAGLADARAPDASEEDAGDVELEDAGDLVPDGGGTFGGDAAPPFPVELTEF